MPPLLEALGATSLEARRGAFLLPATNDSEGSELFEEKELRWIQASSSPDLEGREELAPADLNGVANGLRVDIGPGEDVGNEGGG
jgi:hypothetical protein